MQQPINRSDVRWEWIEKAWKMFSDQMSTWVLIQIVFGLILFAAVIPIVLITGGLAGLSESTRGSRPPGLLVILPMIFTLLLIAVPLAVFLTSGAWHTAVRQLRVRQISVSDLFSGSPSFLRILGLGLIQMLLGIIVQVVISLPTFIVDSAALNLITSLLSNAASFTLGGLLFYTPLLIVDRNQGVLESITNSVNATKSQWWMYALFYFVVSLLAGIGVLLCCIGLLFTSHFIFTVPSVAYRDVFGLSGMTPQQNYSPPPPPNYGEQEPPPQPSSWQ